MQDLICAVIISTIIDSLEWDMTLETKSVIAILFKAGMCVGSYAFGVFSDRFGRAHSLRCSVTILGASLAALLFTNQYLVFPVICLVGVGCGGEITVGGVYFYEFCPNQKRSRLTLLSIWFCIGGSLLGLVAALLLYLNIPLILWKGCCLFNVILCICFFFCRWNMPDLSLIHI